MSEKQKFKSSFNNLVSMPPNAISPLDNDRIDSGTENIIVKLIDYPDEKRFKKALTKMVQATIGGDINKEMSDEIGEELFVGGLQNGLEAGIFTFEVSGVSRAFTHQIVRTRKASYHQQSFRYTFLGSHFNVRMPETIANNEHARLFYDDLVDHARETYVKLCNQGIPFQDARFAALLGTETYIICEYPIKTFLELYEYRACCMFQWEIVHVMKLMKEEVAKVFPWMEQYIKIKCEKTQRCTFQGWESTAHCEFPWNHERVFKSKYYTPESEK